MRAEEILQNFGLTEAEVKLYIAMLKVGEAAASALAKRTNTNRTFTYDRLKKLIELGLASYVIKENKKYFKPAPPSQLLQLLKEREEQLETVIPELEKLEAGETPGPDIDVFYSKAGIKTVLNLALREGKTIHMRGSLSKMKETMEPFFEIWDRQRVRQKTKLRLLTSEWVDLKYGETELVAEEEKSNVMTLVFGNMVVIIFLSEVPTAVLIESEQIAHDNIALFENLWNQEVKIYSGWDGVVKAYFDLLKQKKDKLLGYGFSWQFAQAYGMKISDEWHVKRLAKKIICNFISYDDSESKSYFEKRMGRWKDFNIKFLPAVINGPVNVVISSGMVATIFYTEKKLKTVVNRNKEAIEAYRKHFPKLWEMSKGSK